MTPEQVFSIYEPHLPELRGKTVLEISAPAQRLNAHFTARGASVTAMADISRPHFGEFDIVVWNGMRPHHASQGAFDRLCKAAKSVAYVTTEADLPDMHTQAVWAMLRDAGFEQVDLVTADDRRAFWAAYV